MPGEDAAGRPRRQLHLTAAGAELDRTLAFFRAQSGGYAPEAVEPVSGGVLVRFPADHPPVALPTTAPPVESGSSARLRVADLRTAVAPEVVEVFEVDGGPVGSLPTGGYGTSTGYRSLPSGTYTLATRPAADPSAPPVIRQTVQVQPGDLYTLALFDAADGSSVNAQLVLDDAPAAAPGQGHARLVEGAREPGVVSLAIDDPTGPPVVLADCVNHGLVTGYAPVSTGDRVLRLRSGDREWVLPTRVPSAAPVTFLLTDGPRGPVVHTVPDASASAPRARQAGPGPSAMRERRRRPVLTLVVALVGVLVAGCASNHAGDVTTSDDPVAAATATGQAFLESYVDGDGRVVRRDEGGDTVSEGQAYGMLIAVALGDRQRFDVVWTWTREHLQRPDGLLSWRWADGAVVEKDTVRATPTSTPPVHWSSPGSGSPTPSSRPQAGSWRRRFCRPRETVAVGTTLLPADTVVPAPGAAVDGSGRVLTAGTWTSTTPAAVNPGYFSPRGEQVLAAAAGDPRWAEMSRTQRVVSWQLIGTGLLPPDWAGIDTAGTATPQPGPAGHAPRFGLDAARVPIRMAQSCDPADRAVAASCCPGPTDPTPASSRRTRSTAGRSSTGRTRSCSWPSRVPPRQQETRNARTSGCVRQPSSTRGRRPTTGLHGRRSAASCWTPRCSAGVPDRHGGRPRSLPSAAACAGRSRQL